LLVVDDNKSAAEFTVVKQDSHFATPALPLQPPTPEMNLLMFWHNLLKNSPFFLEQIDAIRFKGNILFGLAFI